MLIWAVKLCIVMWRSTRFDLLLEQASSGHSRNCSFLQPQNVKRDLMLSEIRLK